MRISTSMVFQQGLSAIQDHYTAMAKSQQQIATGERLAKPSDDPVAASRISELDQAIERTRQFKENTEVARDKLAFEEATLGSVVEVLQRVRELGLASNNGSHDATSRGAIADELRQYSDQLLSLANSQDANGEYIFSGIHGETKPFAGDRSYQIDPVVLANQPQTIRIDEERPPIAVGDTGDEVFKVNGTKNVLEAVEELVAAQGETDPAVRTNKISQALADIDAGLGSVITSRSSAGARLNAVENQWAQHDAAEVRYVSARSDLRDTDLAEAISQLNLENTALQAAQQSFAKIQGLSLFDYIR